MIFDGEQPPMRGNEVPFGNLVKDKIFLRSSNFPSSNMQGRIRRQINLLFSTKIPGKI